MEELKSILDLIPSDSQEKAKEYLDTIKNKINKIDKDYKKLENLRNKELESYKEEIEKRENQIEKLKSEDKGIGKVYKEENEKIKSEVINYKQELENQRKEFENQLLNKEIEMQTLKSFSKYKVKNDMSKYLLSDIKESTRIEDGRLKFIDSDGTGMRKDGEDYDLDKYLKERKEQEISEGKSIFFDNSDTIQKVGLDNKVLNFPTNKVEKNEKFNFKLYTESI